VLGLILKNVLKNMEIKMKVLSQNWQQLNLQLDRERLLVISRIYLGGMKIVAIISFIFFHVATSCGLKIIFSYKSVKNSRRNKKSRKKINLINLIT
jgi:hypothetical protein